MRQVLASISAVLVGAGIMMFGYGLLATLLSVRMSMEGIPPFTAGLIMSAFYAGQIIGALHVRRFIESRGHIRIFAAFAALFSAAVLMHVLIIDPVVWGGLRFVEGYLVAGLFMCIESWLNDRATNTTRGTVFSLYMIILYGANAASQYLLTAADIRGSTLFMLVAILFSLALVPIAMNRSPAPALPAHSPFSIAKLLASSPLGMAGCFTSGLALGSFYSIAPRYAAKMGLDTFGIATMVSCGILGGMLGQWPIGRLSDKLERRKVISGVAMVSALLSLGLAALSMWIGADNLNSVHDNPAPFVLIALLGVGLFTLYPLAVAHANDFIEPQHFVAASGGLLMAFAVGATIGPIASSALMEIIGPAGLFLFIAVSGVGLALFALWRHKVAPPAPVDSKGRFQTTTNTSPLLAELDPRAEGAPEETDQLSFSFEPPPTVKDPR